MGVLFFVCNDALKKILFACWVVAFVAAGAYGGDVAPMLAKQIPDENWRVLAAVVALFFVVLVVMNIVAMLASKLPTANGWLFPMTTAGMTARC